MLGGKQARGQKDGLFLNMTGDEKHERNWGKK